MIRLITDALPPFVTGEDPVSGRLCAWYDAYQSTNFAQFYVTESGGAIAVMDTQAIVCAPLEDAEEIGAFLSLRSDITTIYTNLPSVADGMKKQFMAMRAAYQADAHPADVPNLTALYAFLSPYFDDLPPFEAWYLDISYRTRHGFCRQAAVTDEGAILACAMTVAEWSGGALLGGVATDPAHRRQGLAGRCVNHLVHLLQQQGKAVWICPYNEAAHRLYLSLGFVDCMTVTVIERT